MNVDISSYPVENWPVEKIKPYPFNHKKHPEKQISDLAKSIAAQGLLDPLAIDEDGVLISGHGRFEAIKRLGRTHAAVRVLVGLSEDQKTALRIAANKTVSNDYDEEMLAFELTKLSSADFDLSVMGMTTSEIDSLISMIEDVDPADFGAAPSKPKPEPAKRKMKLGKAFGFDAISDENAAVIRAFMARLEQETAQEGAQALVQHMNAYLGDQHAR